MIGAGIPPGRAIDILSQEAGKSRLAPVLKALRADVRAGATLADALSRQPAFPESYHRMVALAEASGTLPRVLERIHDNRAGAQALRRKVTSAMIYPAFLLVVAVGAMAVIGLAVVPQMRAILPPEPLANGRDSSIRTLIGISDWVRGNGLMLIAALAVVASVLVLAGRSQGMRRAVGEVAARLPVLGNLLVTSRLAEMTRKLAMLADAGLPLADALRLTRRSTGSRQLAGTLDEMERSLRSGQSVTEPLRAARHIPPLLTNLVMVGQETGNLGKSLAQAAEIFEEKTKVALERALTLMEPAIILVISLGVGGLIYVVIGALMSVNDLFV